MASNKVVGQQLVIQGSILAMASLIVRLIGFFYRIPLVRIVGTEGMGYYGSAFIIYSFVLNISSYAMPAVISKIVSGKAARGQYRAAQDLFKAALMLMVLIGGLASVLMFINADLIAELSGSPKSAPSIRTLAPSLMIFSIMAVFRGYYQGLNTMIPTALSQIVEQVFNAIFSIVCAMWLKGLGVEYGASGGTMGTGIGAFSGLVFLLIIYWMAQKTFSARVRRDQLSGEPVGLLTNWQILMMTAAPILIGSTAYNLSGMLDMIIVQRGLAFHGMSESQVGIMYGVLSSKYTLLITLPVSLGTALSAASLPSISRSLAEGAYSDVQKKAVTALRTITMIAIPAAFGLGVLSTPILKMLFGADELVLTSNLMKIGAISIIFYCTSSVSIAILQGIGKLKIPLKHTLMALAVKFVALLIVIYGLGMGLYGAVLTNIIYSSIIAISNYRSVKQEIRIHMDVVHTYIKPGIAAILMSIAAYVVYYLVGGVLGAETLGTFIGILVAVMTYFSLLLLMGVLTEEILRQMPMGTRLIGYLKKVGLFRSSLEG